MANTDIQERDKARVVRRLQQIKVCLMQAAETGSANVKADALDEANGLIDLALDSHAGIDRGGNIVDYMRGEAS